MPVESVERVYEHIFIREHYFERDDVVKRFDPDYYMIHSWRRLRHNDNIQPHDLTMLKHELEEERIMGKRLDISYESAHKEAESVYNYREELKKYLEDHDV